MKDLSFKTRITALSRFRIASAMFLSLPMLCSSITGRTQTFSMAVEPTEVFPLPCMNEPTSAPAAPTTTFYNGRSGGSCYNYTFDFDGRDGDDEVSVWALNSPEVTLNTNAVAYEVVNMGSIKYRGTAFVGGDIAELNVGMYEYNGDYRLVVAYWMPAPSQIRLRTYSMTTTGLVELSDELVASCPPLSPTRALHISLDCHDMKYFTVCWENVAEHNIYMKAYKVDGPLVISPNVIVAYGGPNELRFPDIAMSHQGVYGDLEDKTGINVHLACADVTNNAIYKYTIDFNSLFPPFTSPSYTIDDMIPLVPIGPRFDEFQLKVDAPDHYVAPRSNWSMVYYDNDAYKIKLRMANYALSPAVNSYVVNDGTLTGSSGDISMAGNAFPSVSYHPEGDKVYVAWFTNYDPAGLSPATLYGYQNFSVRYLSVIVDDNGNQVHSDYQLVDADYRRNFIYDYPKICLSKHNESEKLLTIFSCHGPTEIWPRASLFSSSYTEYDGAIPTGPGVTPVVAGINYDGVPNPLVGGTGRYLAHKSVNWYGGGPFYRPTSAATLNSVACGISVYPNPFTQSKWFRLNGGCDRAIYVASLLSIEGKLIATYNGTVDKLNTAFTSLQSRQLVAGVYTLKIMDASGRPIQQQLIIKR